MMRVFFSIFYFLFFFQSCSYKVGNLVSLSYPVETKLRTQIIREYLDTFIIENHTVPTKWDHERKLVDLDSINNKRVYFKSNPEEMFLISLSGMVVLQDVYNPTIKQSGWVARREDMPQKEAERVMNRFQTEVLHQIEVRAKKNGVSDSIIYKK